ncbi:GTP binding protein [Coemansia sp. RSA 1933]|nr:GTP binding protein [Coemansia sp. RSA 1933]
MTTRDPMYTEDFAAGNFKEHYSLLDETVSQIPPEMDRSGNVEYKTKLEAVTDTRTTHLATQLQWRLAEGNGHAVYMVGVRDDGFLVGITEAELDATISVIRRMARQLANVAIVSIKKRVLPNRSNRVVAEVHMDQHSNTLRTEVRVAVLGDLGVGKSTVLGCLTYGEADDGRGKSRLNLLRHRHEVESGRTSSIALGVVGFNADGQVLNYANNRSAEQIYQRSRHVVTLIDTCGYAKHLKTTARAIAGHSPHAFCVTIAADRGAVTQTTREYLRIAAVLKMPLMIVLTKMDIAAKTTFAALMHDILATLDVTVPGRGRCIVTSTSESKQLAEDMMGLVVVPIFTTSAVRTLGFSELTAVLSKTQQSNLSGAELEAAGSSPSFEFHVEHTYSIDDVGIVVTGWVNRGSVSIGTGAAKKQLCIGPTSAGDFVNIEINSIHTLRIPTEIAEAGTSAALAIKTSKPESIEKGMVILDRSYLSKSGRKRISTEFTARIAILNQEFRNMQSVIVHIRSAYRLAQVLAITDAISDDPQQQDGLDRDHAVVRLRFDDNVCDYLSPGLPIVARDGQNIVFAGHV